MLFLISKSAELSGGLKSKDLRSELLNLIAQLESQSEEDEIIRYSRWLKEKIHV